MSRDPYRTSQRWDTDRFAAEQDRSRFNVERYEERDTRITRAEDFDRRRPSRGYEEDRYRERIYYDEPEEPRFRRPRGQSITIEREKEREFVSPSTPTRPRPLRPGLARRQSSLDTYDRRPLRGYDREEYGPPARREDFPPIAFVPVPLPQSRALPPPRRYEERDVEEVRISEQAAYEEDYRPFPERIREREVITTRRRSRSRGSRERRSSVSSSSSSSSRTTTVKSVRNEFPKRGKTKIPARLVSRRAIIDLGYPFIEEGDIIIIQKALSRENIDELIKLSEQYKIEPRKTVMEEIRKEEIIEVPVSVPLDPPPPPVETVVETTTTTIDRDVSPRRHVRSRSVGPIVATTTIERSNEIPIGPMVLVGDRRQSRNEREIKAEIRALEAEKDALRAERRAERRLREADRVRVVKTVGDEVVLYEREERIEPPRGVRIEKDKKGPKPKALKTMLATLT